MATPARTPLIKSGWWKTPILAGLIAITISLVTYSFSAVKTSGGDEVDKVAIHEKLERKVDREKYDTDMAWIKETLKEMKTDIKEIKGEKK
jgi:hypothetical protein